MQTRCVTQRAAAAAAVGVLGSVAFGQSLDVGLFIERFDSGFFEAELSVTTDSPFLSAVILDPGPEQVLFREDSDTEFEFEVPIDPGTTLEAFLADDEGTVDIAFVQIGGAISVYRLSLSNIFGATIDLDALPDFASNIELDFPIGGTPTLTWDAPTGPLGTFLLLEGEVFETDDFVFFEASPLPFPLIQSPPQTLPSLNITSRTLAEPQVAQPLQVRVIYGDVLGPLNLQRISGPALAFVLEDAVFLTTADRAFVPCREADNAAPFGVIDARDVIGAVEAANSGELGDIDGSGSLDFFDLLVALMELDEGC